MFRVYKITNILNGKIYIGYTKQTLYARLYGHYSEPRNTIISRSIRKYGVDNFNMDQLFEFDNEVDAKSKEIELIANYQTNTIKYPHGNGMNMTDGGEGARGYKHTDELRAKWSTERKGNIPSNLAIQKRVTKVQKLVYQFTQDGKIVAVHASAKLAGAAVGSGGANISLCCRGLSQTVKGYIFQYTDIFIPRDVTHGNEKRVNQYDKSGQLINTFCSIQRAAESLNIDRSGIDKCIMGRSKTSHGYTWSH